MPAGSEKDLISEEHQALEAAHAELRDALAAYESFLGRVLHPGEAVPVMNANELGLAHQARQAIRFMVILPPLPDLVEHEQPLPMTPQRPGERR